MIGTIKIVASTNHVKHIVGRSNCWSFKNVCLSISGLNQSSILLSVDYRCNATTVMNIEYGKTTGFE